jgi:hypothetical protein
MISAFFLFFGEFLHPADKKWRCEGYKGLFLKKMGPKLHYDQKNSEVAIFR